MKSAKLRTVIVCNECGDEKEDFYKIYNEPSDARCNCGGELKEVQKLFTVAMNVRKMGILEFDSREIVKNKYKYLEIFSVFLPMHSESNMVYMKIRYFGYSDLFDEIADGECTPVYDVVECDSEELHFKFVRREGNTIEEFKSVYKGYQIQ